MNSYEEVSQKLKANPQKWFVTGAAGFVGSNLCFRLLELNQKVIGFDNFLTGNKKNISDISSQYKKNWQFIEGDICNLSQINEVTKNVDFILHQAAVGSVPRSIKEPILSHTHNVTGFLNVIESARINNIKKIVYASSSSVYGDDPTLPKVENRVGAPLSPYAVTKKMNEIYAEIYHRCYKLPTVGLRYFNVFGPRQDPSGPYAAVIPLWIESLIQNQTVYINGDGSYSRDFCFIDNVVQANILAALSPDNTSGQVYNIAYGGRTDLNQLFRYIQDALKEKIPDFIFTNATYRDFRSGDIPHSHADISRAKSDLHYNPQISAAEGLKKTVDYFIDAKLNKR